MLQHYLKFFYLNAEFIVSQTCPLFCCLKENNGKGFVLAPFMKVNLV